jgi:hypothetical protein
MISRILFVMLDFLVLFVQGKVFSRKYMTKYGLNEWDESEEPCKSYVN